MAKKETSVVIVPDEIIIRKIYKVRGQKVMLDKDLAELYEVETKALKRAVNRNKDIFPEHFMFELSTQENEILRSQTETSKTGRGGTRYLPMVFTEYGILQLSNVLKSKRARQVSVRIIEVFVKLQKMIADNTKLQLGLERVENKTDNNTKNIELVFQYLDELMEKQENPKPRTQIGFKTKKKK